MLVLHPSILALGALAAAVPIIIHLLLKRRKPPMAWGAMRFVLEAYRRTRRRSIERWLLLAARVLLLLVAGLVLARPIVGRVSGSAAGGPRTLYIILDDSIASQTRSGSDADLSISVERARRAIDALAPGDRAGVILASAPSRGLIVPPSVDLAGVRSALGQIEASDAAADWPGSVALLRAELARETDLRGASVLLASAWREGTLAAASGLSALPEGVAVVATDPTDLSVTNTSVIAARAARPVLLSGQNDSSQTVTVDLRRSGSLPAERTGVRIAQGGTLLSQGQVEWSTGQRESSVTIAVSPPATAGGASPTAMSGVLTIDIQDDALNADNRMMLPLLARDALRVGIIDGPSSVGSSPGLRAAQWARLALRPSESSPMDVVPIEPGAVDVARLNGLDALWLLAPDAITAEAWPRIAAWHRAGGLLIVSPPAGLNSHAWPDAMNAALGLNWSIPRSAETLAEGVALSAALGEPTSAAAPGDLLAAIRGEMLELVRPVSVSRLLAPDTRPPPNADATFAARAILSTGDGRPVLTALRSRDAASPGGVLLCFSVAPDAAWTDLVAKPLMVPLVQELVRQGVGLSRPGLSGIAGVRPVLPSGAAELRSIDGSQSRSLAGAGTPGAQGDTVASRASEAIRKAGLWRVIDGAGIERGVLAINPAVAAAGTAVQPRQRIEAALSALLPPGAALSFGTDGVAGSSTASGGEPIGAGAALLWIVLALLLVELALAWTTSRAGTAAAITGGGAA